MGGWRVSRLVTGVMVIGALASGCGPAAERAAQLEPSAESSGQESPDGEGDTGTEPPPGADPTEEPPPGPTPAPATGDASETGTSLAGLASACCVAELPGGEDLLVGSGDTVLLRRADGGGELIELGRLPGELLGLAVSPTATGRFVNVFAYFAGPDGGQVGAYPYFPRQEWDRWGDSPSLLLDTPVPLSGDGGGALAFGPDRELYLATDEGQILLLDPNGSDEPVVHSPGPYTDLRGLAWDEDRMWAVDAGPDGTARLYSVTPGGPPIEVELPGVGAVDPAGLAASEGSLWMPGAADGQVWRIPLNGSNALAADPAPVMELPEPRAVFTARGSTDLWALAGDSLRRLQVD